MEIFKNPQKLREKYSNAIHLSDKQLARFFELLHERHYLENSIVIITGDHSFPMSEHGVYNNEICYYDETFRIPLLVIWEGALQSERVSGKVYSQIDIAPTIMDLLGIRKEENTFLGISIFDRTTPHPAYLVQPYNGCFIETVQYPLKFIRHVKTGNEYLFDLVKDPGEKTNLIGSVDQAELGRLRKSLEPILINQNLIEENRIRK
jgi:arylsulfatase A-like enzyme